MATPHSPQLLSRVLTPDESDYAGYVETGAIKHPDWRDQRIDFQPYPFPSYTEELVRLLKETTVAGERGFLDGLDPAFVARDLMDDRFVKKTIEDIGGLSQFGLADDWTRQEVFEI
ncbi:hypothetical protein [Yoonia sp.]|uniref:hypothetical protein n=1 Tax=Yoonia sp. TaxID=2212373 RepID=UPI003A4E464B